MSDSYYNQGSQYGQSQYPQGGYSQPSGYQPQYNQQPQGGYPPQDFGPPRRHDSFGPPQNGGFQHGQAGGQYGAYDASNPQGHAGFFGGPSDYQQPQSHQQQPSYGQAQQYSGGSNDAFAQNQAYQQQLAQGGSGVGSYPNAAQNHQFAPQSSDPNAPNYDPNAPPMTESERGLLGALAGGVGGHHFGKKQNHGFLGTVGGAIIGSFAEDFMKDKKKKNKHSSHGASSWGGGSKW